MTNYLVTGPTGFLGFHVIKHLNEQGHKPRVLMLPDVEETSPARESFYEFLAIDNDACRFGKAGDPHALRDVFEYANRIETHDIFVVDCLDPDIARRTKGEG